MVNALRLSVFSVIAITLCMFSTSCVNTKRITYLNNLPDSNYVTPYELSLAHYSDPRIQPNDILQITVQTLDPQASNLMGVQSSTSYNLQAGTNGGNVQGYMVDGEGFISLPLVGKIKVAGLSTTEVKSAIEKKAAMYYKDPVVNVRFVNFTVTVLGEVNHPGQFTLSNEQTSVFDIIGAGGDMTSYAKRNEVLVIREENGVKKFVRINLYSTDAFRSPYFYLRQRDVVYIPPNKSKAIATNANEGRILGFASFGISVLSFLLVIIRL